MKDFISYLVQQSHSEKVAVTSALDDALANLDHMLSGICADLQVEFEGPYVGVETLKAHRLVVRPHEWKIHEPSWSMKICSAAPQANYRAEWAVQSAGRLRKQVVVKALPDFFSGFAKVVEAAGKAELPSGKRVLELAQRFAV